MQARTYSLAALSVAFGLFAGVAAVNLLVDPEAVLGTGVLGKPLNFNDRYLSMEAYEADPDRYDGLLFGASRGNVIPQDLLSELMGGATFANFSAIGGQIIDHVAVLEHVLRTKAARGKRLRAVFLLLDVDLFGDRQFANRTIQSQWHPVLTGESMARFKWRYLTAIQTQAWRDEVRRAMARAAVRAEGAADDKASAPRVRSASLDREPAVVTSDAAPPAMPPPETITTRDDFARQLALLAKFVALCQADGVRLVVALSPLRDVNAARFDRVDVEAAVARIADIVPVWDFDVPAWLSQRPDLWLDTSHYAPAVARMMLGRIFGVSDATPYERPPAGFGVLRTRRVGQPSFR